MYEFYPFDHSDHIVIILSIYELLSDETYKHIQVKVSITKAIDY